MAARLLNRLAPLRGDDYLGHAQVRPRQEGISAHVLEGGV
jgi:hypothetical protein